MKPEVIYDRIFYRITMKTYDNKKLYLKASIGNSCEWTFNRQDAIWFESDKDAQEFASKYFKNFSNYEIEQFVEYM